MVTEVFVFGSNEAGRHGKGAALFARQNHGAVYGQGVGLQGRSYAIPTKDSQLNTLPLEKIKTYVDEFIKFTKANPSLQFNVTRIGCGLAGYKDKDIAPMFIRAYRLTNVKLPDEFMHVICSADTGNLNCTKCGNPTPWRTLDIDGEALCSSCSINSSFSNLITKQVK